MAQNGLIATDELTAHGHGASASIDYASGYFSGMSGELGGVFTKLANQTSNAGFDETNYYDRIAIQFNHNHGHDITIAMTGGNNSHENRPPYEAVQRWRRTA